MRFFIIMILLSSALGAAEKLLEKVDIERELNSPTRVQSFNVPGQGWRKVKLQFRAKVNGLNTVENNPLQEILPEMSTLSVFRLSIAGADKKPVFKRGSGYPLRGFIDSGNWREYGQIFYLRPGESNITLSIVPRDEVSGIQLNNIRLYVIDEPEIAINSDRTCRYSGIARFERAGRAEEDINGNWQVNTMPNGNVQLEALPVEPGKKYRFAVTWNKSSGTDNRIRCHMTFRDKDGNKLNDYVWYCDRKKAEKNKDDFLSINEFIPPENSEIVEIAFYSGIIENCSLKLISK